MWRAQHLTNQLIWLINVPRVKSSTWIGNAPDDLPFKLEFFHMGLAFQFSAAGMVFVNANKFRWNNPFARKILVCGGA